MQSTDNDDKPFEPHTGVYTHADEINDVDISPESFEPEELWRKTVAEEHANPPIPPVRTKDPIEERKFFVLIAAVPRDKEFHSVGVGDDRTCQKNNLRHLIHVLRRDDGVQ